MLKILTIAVTGPDALEFLQGQLTNDLKLLDSEAEIFAAWCNPKGRVIWFGTVWGVDGGFGLSAIAATAEDIVKRLTFFRFRSKVEFEIIDDGVNVDPVEIIRDGYPIIGAEQSEKFTPHMLNLDLLAAVSFDKGCYTGQEIVARTHHKGATKRRALRFESESPVKAGDKVSIDGRDIGEVLNVAGTDLLAVVPTDKTNEQLSVLDSKLTLVPLPYLDIPAS
jgi:folate-binding protein YgfZ